MLPLEEGHLFGGSDGELVRDIKTGERILAASRVPWVLGESQSGAGNAGAEDFTYVIQRAAIGVCRAHAQLLERIARAELSLQSVVVREAAIVTFQNQAFGAISTAKGGICRLSGTKQDLRAGAAGESRWRGRVACNNGIAVHG